VTDPTLYLGTGGTVLALQRVSQFLKHENSYSSGVENIENTEHEEEETKEETPIGLTYDIIF